MTTEEGNKLIAKFMGSDWDTFEHTVPTMLNPANGKYHSSWDWQIPVWSKFLQLVTKDRMKHHPSKHPDNDLVRTFEINFRQAIFANDLMGGQKELCAAIQWYNIQTKDAGTPHDMGKAM